MMKFFKKITAATLAVAATLAMAVSCGGGGGSTSNNGGKESNTPDTSGKTQLNVGVFDAGLGTVYFDEMAKDFEEYYKDTSFEEGKKGVAVIPLKKKEEYKPGNLIATMTNYDNVLYFLDQGNYTEFASKGLIADITDTVEEKFLDEDGNLAKDTGKAATQSIKDTMVDGYADCFLYNGKYYAVPFWIQVPGIIYNADLFNEKRFYFKANGSLGAIQADIDAGNCGAGPDGKLGTADDGLPATWNDFVSLMKQMVNSDVTPFAWDATHEYQRSGAFTQIWANYEGYNNFMLNYTFNGTDSVLGEITEENYKDLANQEGRKAAIKAFYDITGNDKNYTRKSVSGNNHLEAQKEFINSVVDGSPVAMFLENSYWESEARSTFNQLAQEDPSYAYGKHDYRFMPIPKFTGVNGIKDQTNTERVIAGRGADNYICIAAKNNNKNSEIQTGIAKLFIRFVQQRSQLVKFTANTGCFRSFKYTATAEETATYTKYTQSIAKYIAEGAKLTSNLPVAEKRRNNVSLFDEENNAFAFIVTTSTGALYDPFSYFKYSANKGKTVDDCFNEFKKSFADKFKV